MQPENVINEAARSIATQVASIRDSLIQDLLKKHGIKAENGDQLLDKGYWMVFEDEQLPDGTKRIKAHLHQKIDTAVASYKINLKLNGEDASGEG